MTEKYFEVEGEKGILRGIYHIPDNRIAATVIMTQGYFSATKIGAARLHVLLARRICKMGFSVYRFDFYGTGDSDGDYEEVRFSTEIADLYRVRDYVTKCQPNLGPLILIGHSFGGNIALYASKQTNAQLVVALSTIPPKNGIDIFFTPDMSEELETQGWTYRKGFYITREFVDATRSDEFIKNVNPNAKILLVHGIADEFVPKDWPIEMQRRLRGSTLRWITEGDHNFFVPRARKEVLTVVPDMIAKWYKSGLDVHVL
ncbi:MAG: alpha/beta fold hydrolase [Desulfobacteria bacterium]